ncbi:MAG: TonB-dependent receptor [Myxococcota bacterium]
MTLSIKKSFAPLILLVFLSQPTFAEEVVDVGTVKVSERRERQESLIESESGFVTVIEVSGTPTALSVSELLSREAGVSTRSLGGLGSFALVSIRGSSSEQVNIYVDGIPMNNAAQEGFDISALSFAGVERIEVYRGYTPPHLPSSAMGGAINIVTSESGKESFSAQAQYGSFFTRGLAAGYSAPLKRGRLYLSGEYLGSEGDFQYLDDRGTAHNLDDDLMRKRENNHFNQGDIRVGISNLEFGACNRLSAALEGFVKRQGIPGRGNIEVTGASLETQRYDFTLSFTRDPETARALIVGAGFYGFINTLAFSDEKAEISLGSLATSDRDFLASISPFIAYRYQPYGETSLRLNLKNELYYPEYILPEPIAFPTTKRLSAESVLSQELWLIPDRFALKAQGRAEFIGDRTGENPIETLMRFTPREYTDSLYSAQGGARFRAVSDLWLKTSGGFSERAPDFAEMFGDKGFRIGNPNLKPEEGRFIDGGFSFLKRGFWFFDSIYLENALFYRRVNDLIWFVKFGNFPSQAQNIGKAEFVGDELKLSFALLNRLGLTLNYTYIRAKNHSEIPYQNGMDIPFNPRSELFISPRFFRDFVEFSYEFTYASQSFADRANLTPVPSRIIQNLNLTVALHSNISLSASIKNLTDERITDYEGFPLPGRSAYISLKITD